MSFKLPIISWVGWLIVSNGIMPGAIRSIRLFIMYVFTIPKSVVVVGDHITELTCGLYVFLPLHHKVHQFWLYPGMFLNFEHKESKSQFFLDMPISLLNPRYSSSRPPT